MNKNDKEKFEQEYYDVTSFRQILHDLEKKTTQLFKDIGEEGSENIKLKELRASEIFSLFNSAKLLSTIKDFQHYEFLSLFTFWEQFYDELVEILEVDDSNHSWASTRFNNFKGQYEIVDQMLVDKSDYLKGKLDS